MKKIAIIDDEQDILDTLESFLQRSEKFEITKYSNPITALSEVKNRKFDLILLDIMMPELDGIEFLKEMKNTTPDTKVLIMTAYSTIDRAIECDELGADEYITKPFISLKDVENKIFDSLEM